MRKLNDAERVELQEKLETLQKDALLNGGEAYNGKGQDLKIAALLEYLTQLVLQKD